MPPEIHQMPGPDEWPINNDVKPIQPPLLKKSQCSMPKKVRIRALDKDQPHETINVTQHEYMMYAVEIVVRKATMLYIGVAGN